MGSFATLSIMILNLWRRCAECRDYLNVRLSVVVLGVVMQNVSIVMSTVMLGNFHVCL
jgi:hypothetical protein